MGLRFEITRPGDMNLWQRSDVQPDYGGEHDTEVVEEEEGQIFLLSS